jgi:hypothetical protein
MPVTDTNWYMSEFGFFYHAADNTATVTVGSYECKMLFHNDSLIQCNAVYGQMYKPLDVVVSVHGKGAAEGGGNFTFALIMHDVLPPSGSLAGGTEVTIKTTSLTAAKDLGFTTYVETNFP